MREQKHLEKTSIKIIKAVLTLSTAEQNPLMRLSIEKWIKYLTKNFIVMKLYMTNNDEIPLDLDDMIL